ncbi:hypothetical protein MGAS2111_2119, partial [Streptococcus pyogenes MGAS2111]
MRLNLLVPSVADRFISRFLTGNMSPYHPHVWFVLFSSQR